MRQRRGCGGLRQENRKQRQHEGRAVRLLLNPPELNFPVRTPTSTSSLALLLSCLQENLHIHPAQGSVHPNSTLPGPHTSTAQEHPKGKSGDLVDGLTVQQVLASFVSRCDFTGGAMLGPSTLRAAAPLIQIHRHTMTVHSDIHAQQFLRHAKRKRK